VTAGTIEVSGRAGGPVAVPAGALDDLAARVDGRLLRAGDPGWEEALGIWNGMAASTPALVLQPGSAAEVAAGVGFARDHGLLLGVKGGGHHIAGTAIADGGLVLDLSGMRTVTVDPEARLAQVGPGCRSPTSTGPPRPTAWPPRSASSRRSAWPGSPWAAASAT
jgi:hypothetical protein